MSKTFSALIFSFIGGICFFEEAILFTLKINLLTLKIKSYLFDL